MSATKQIRVMIVDAHTIMREGLKEVLAKDGDFQVVGEAGDGAAAVETASVVNPDVVTMDVVMPVKNGVEACREIRDLLPNTRVLMLTASTDEVTVLQAVAAGATGYLEKFCSRERFLSTVRDVSEGEFRMPAEVMRSVFSNVHVRTSQREDSDVGVLTIREREILALFSQGLSYADIAEVKGNRPLTVRNAIYAIQRKLKVRTKQELVVHAVRSGLLDP